MKVRVNSLKLPNTFAYFVNHHLIQGVRMATLQQQIAEKFLARLAESKVVSTEKTEKLRLALESDKKPKAEDYVRIFAEPDHGDIK
jgi:hypothetical protein